MSGEIERVTIEGDDVTLPLLIWRRFRRPMPGLFEQVLAANAGLAALGPVLPLGHVVEIPIPTDKRAQGPLAAVRLW